MKRIPKKSIEKHIIKFLKYIEDYTVYEPYDPDLDFIDYLDKPTLTNTFPITLKRIETKKVGNLEDEVMYDVEFIVEHKGNTYTFETSNYYHYSNGLFIEDIYENINNLLRNFEFLLESYDYFIGNSSSDKKEECNEDVMIIDDVAYGLGFEIDDDGHWIPLENDYDYNEFDVFRDRLECDGEKYIFNDTDENGRFYWED